jgi:ATP-dependent Clp protease ATP-binding subunit ClpC
LPDKAIDALDEAGSRVHISNIKIPTNIVEIEKEIEEFNQLKFEAVRVHNYELATSLLGLLQVQRALSSRKSLR